MGYEGSLEEFIALISGRDGQDGEDGVGVKEIYVNENGELIVILTNEEEINCGNVRGEDGTDGEPGEDGKPGADGVGVKDMYVDENGDLIVVLTNDEEINCGHIRGEDGTDGEPGEDGKPGADGVGVKDMYVDENGDLIVVLTNDEEINCGHVRGEDGTDGKPGEDGEDGTGIQNMYINEDGHLIVVLSNNQEIDCGSVREETVAAESISLDQTEMTLELGETAKLTATVLPAETTNKTVAWNSTDENVAAVYDDGTVEAVSEGSAVIVAVTDNNKFALCAVTVVAQGDGYVEVTGIKLDSDSLELTAGGTVRLTATVQPENATEPWISWSSSAPSVVAVREDGTLYALSSGTAEITAQAVNGITAKCAVTVSDDPQMSDFVYEYTFDESGGGFGCTILGVQAASTGKTELVVPEYVTSIAYGAFKDCYSLVSLTTPVAEQNLGYYFGVNVSEENDVALPSNFTEIIFTGDRIDANAFKNCISLRTVRAEDGLVEICEGAFNGCISLNSVTLPSSLRVIGGNAFGGCISLAEISLPEGLEVISSVAFNGCISLRSIAIPASVVCIEDSAFESCTVLESIAFLGGPEYIGYNVFLNCPNLKKVSVEDLARWCAVNFASYDMNPFYITHDLYVGDELVRDLVIPGEVRSIGRFAFSGCGITSVTFESGVVSVGDGAFLGCEDLAAVTVSDTIENIGVDAFGSCMSLNKVSVDDLATWTQINFGSPYANPLWLAHDLYVGGNIVRNLVIPSGVPYVGQYAFYGSSITSVTFESGIRSIGRGAFGGCASLASVSIANSLTTIGDGAFENCGALASVIIADGSHLTNIGSSAFNECIVLKGITLPSGVTSIGSMAFGNCMSLESIALPSSITSIGDAAFRNCGAMTSAEFGAGSRLASIGGYVFSGCASLESVDFPSGLVRIPDGMFENCFSLKTVEFPNSVVVIGNNVFSGCIALESVALPENLASIPDGMFQNCTSLKTVEFPNSVVVIGNNVFNGCIALESVIFPENLASISDGMFQNCTSLKTVELPGSVTSIGNNVFNGCTSLESVVLPENLTGIPDGMFQNCTSLKTVELPGSVTRIGNNAFNGCTALENIAFPAGVVNIGEFAFQNCGALASVEFGADSRLESIGVCAFAGCGLKELTIPANVVSIEQAAFQNCGALTSVEFGAGSRLESIGAYVFEGCGLKELTIPAGVTSVGNNILWDAEIVYCEASARPSGWDENWYTGLVVWDCLNNDMATDGNIYTEIDGILYAIRDGSASVMRVVTGTEIVVPASIEYRGETYSVTAVRESAFTDFGVESVVLPEGLLYIEAQAFYNVNIEWVILPKSLLSIGSGNFPYPFNTIIYFNGNEEELQKIVNYSDLLGRNLYYYSADGSEEEGDWWHYVDGAPVPWEWGDVKVFRFETNGGSEIADISAVALTELPYPTREGYIFGGWFDNAELSGNMVVAPYYDAVKTTLYAKWIDSSTIVQSEGLMISGGLIVGIGTCTDEVLVLDMPVADRAFAGCNTITKVVFGTGVTSIGASAFSGCNNLKTVVFLSPLPPVIGSDLFSGTWDALDFTVYVPQGSLSAYRAVNDNYWRNSLVNTGKIKEMDAETVI